MNLRLLLGGVKSYLPIRSDYTGTGGSTSADYCYGIWLRHLVLVHRQGLETRPDTLVELGPGDPVGVGRAALLTGTERYLALDVVGHADAARAVEVFDRIHALLRERADMPGDDRFPGVHPKLDDYRFPSHVLDEGRLDAALAPERVARLRAAVAAIGTAGAGAPVRYVCPWTDPTVVDAGVADMVLSHVVLQDIDDLGPVFAAMRRWLRPGGIMSHQIDFAGADKSRAWNDHWSYPDVAWRLVRGRRPYYVNRQPLSAYLAKCREHGFDVADVRRLRDTSGLPRERLAPSFRRLDDDDLTTSAAYVVAVRR